MIEAKTVGITDPNSHGNVGLLVIWTMENWVYRAVFTNNKIYHATALCIEDGRELLMSQKMPVRYNKLIKQELSRYLNE